MPKRWRYSASSPSAAGVPNAVGDVEAGERADAVDAGGVAEGLEVGRLQVGIAQGGFADEAGVVAGADIGGDEWRRCASRNWSSPSYQCRPPSSSTRPAYMVGSVPKLAISSW